MKNLATVAIVFAGSLLMAVFNLSCSKSNNVSNLSNEQMVVGRWNINRIQLRLYYNGIFFKDTIIPQTPMPENFIQFDAVENFEYRFNTASIDAGTYQYNGMDSIISTTSNKIYRWKILTLTGYLFTMMNTSSNPSFPGAIVETYYTLVH